MYTKKNDDYDKVRYRATTRLGELIDLTGSTIQFKMESRSGQLLVNSPGSIVNSANGEMEYQFQDVDTIIAGVHRAEFTVTFPDGKEKTFPEDGYIQVTITSDIDTDRDTAQQEQVAIYVSEIETFKTDMTNQQNAFETSVNTTVDEFGTRLDTVEAEQVDQDARIDNLVANTGDSNSEIVDLRLGADNVARSVAGDLMREIHKEQLLANQQKKTLVHGINLIESDTNVASDVKVEFYGQNRVNHMGKQGGFHEQGKWDSNLVIDTSTYKFGTSSGKIDNSAGATRKYSINTQKMNLTGKYLLLGVWAKANSGTPTSRLTIVGYDSTGGYVQDKFQDFTINNTWKFYYFKVDLSSSTSSYWDTQLHVRTYGTADDVVNFDGLMVTPIYSEVYNEIGVLPEYTGDALADKFPYVDSIKGVKNPVLKVSGENLSPTNYGEWEQGEINGDGTLSGSSIRIRSNYFDVVGGVEITSSTSNNYEMDAIYYYDKNKSFISNSVLRNSNPSTVTTPLNARYAKLKIRNVNTSLTITVDELSDIKPMLNLGTTAKPFEVKNDSYLMAETTLYGNDNQKDILFRNESLDVPRWEVKRIWKDRKLEGLTYSHYGNGTDVKSVYTANFFDVDMSNLTYELFDTNGVNNGEKAVAYGNTALYITNIPNSITGFTNAMTPTSNMWDGYFNGWKYTGDGTTHSWVSIVDGTTTPSTQSETFVADPVNSPSDYKNYFLLYQLAESVTEYAPKHFTVEGDVSIEGDAQVSVTSGFSYTEDTEGNRTYTLTPESERYAETCNLNEVVAHYSNSMKSSFQQVVAKQSDIATEVSIHDRQILDMMIRLDAGGL